MANWAEDKRYIEETIKDLKETNTKLMDKLGEVSKTIDKAKMALFIVMTLGTLIWNGVIELIKKEIIPAEKEAKK